MPTRLLLPIALALAAAPTIALAAPAEQAWVTASNANARLVLDAQAVFVPEAASQRGLSQYDGLVSDLGPRLSERSIAASRTVLAELARRLAAETDANVRQDLQILIKSVENDIAGTELSDRHFLAWSDAPQNIFFGVQSLLDDQIAPARRAKALDLLQRYVGLYPGTTATTELAKARFEESRAPGKLGPYRATVDDSIASAATYAKGIRALFAKYGIKGGEPALKALDRQVADYTAWQRKTVLPVARADFRQPADVYAFSLKGFGIDIDPDVLVERAQLEFMETRAAMQALAPLVARDKGLKPGSYVDVIRQLKLSKIPNDQIEARYAEVNKQLEAITRRERIVDLPDRPMVMRLASEAESAASPAPHMQPPPLIGNKGEQGQFVLPVSVSTGGGKADVYDDFDYPSAMWTVSAHEGRPGHELQFTAMVERGVSQARSLFAFNSVNVEGWGLYAEAEALPHEPLDGQLIAYQLRLLRAARAMLDPMLNLGRISIDDARRVLLDEVALSPAMARQELDRYTSRAPGQAGSYFYGYTRILQLRAETELALGPKFDRLAFNNFLLDQGLLPPDLLAKAVRETFVPAQRAKR